MAPEPKLLTMILDKSHGQWEVIEGLLKLEVT